MLSSRKNVKKSILLFTDTDSLCCKIGEDFYEMMHQNKSFFDLSNQTKDTKYYCNDNKKVPGKMKDEYRGTNIYEFIGLKPKMYSMRDVNKKKKV